MPQQQLNVSSKSSKFASYTALDESWLCSERIEGNTKNERGILLTNTLGLCLSVLMVKDFLAEFL